MQKITQGQKKIILEVIILFASIPIFRGVWMLADIYLLPENNLASAILSLFIGLIILIMALYCFNKKDTV